MHILRNNQDNRKLVANYNQVKKTKEVRTDIRKSRFLSPIGSGSFGETSEYGIPEELNFDQLQFNIAPEACQHHL